MLNATDTASILSGTGGANSSQTGSVHSSSLPNAATPLSAVLTSGDASSSSGHASLSDFRRPLQGFPEPKIPKTIFELSLSLDDVDEEEIARQFTCLDSETFHRVKTQELIKNAWLKNRGRKAKRVVLLLNAANALSKWVLDSISNATGSIATSGSSLGAGVVGMTPNQSSSTLSGVSGSHPNASSASSGNLSSASGLVVGSGVGASAGIGGQSSASSGASSTSVSSSGAASGVSSTGSSMVGTDGSTSGSVGGANASESNAASGDVDSDGDASNASHLEKTSCISSVLTQKANPQLQHHSLSSQVTSENTKRIVKTIAKWIRIAEHLRTLNNFHSLLAIWVALRSRYVNSAFSLLKKEFPKSILDVRTHFPLSSLWPVSILPISVPGNLEL